MFKNLEKDIGGFVKSEEIMKYLKGTNFPTNLQNIINTLRNNNAPPQVVSAANKLPNKTYNSPQDFANEIKDMLGKL
ncbi:MAG: DUF2795 domain-containing protein [Chloroflexota bacterium]